MHYNQLEFQTRCAWINVVFKGIFNTSTRISWKQNYSSVLGLLCLSVADSNINSTFGSWVFSGVSCGLPTRATGVKHVSCGEISTLECSLKLGR